MSRLEELIAELCPNGVEYKTLGEVVTFLNGRAYKQPELLSEGKYKVLRVGNFYTNDKWYYSDLELEDDKYCDKGDLLFAWDLSFGWEVPAVASSHSAAQDCRFFEEKPPSATR